MEHLDPIIFLGVLLTLVSLVIALIIDDTIKQIKKIKEED